MDCIEDGEDRCSRIIVSKYELREIKENGEDRPFLGPGQVNNLNLAYAQTLDGG